MFGRASNVAERRLTEHSRATGQKMRQLLRFADEQRPLPRVSPVEFAGDLREAIARFRALCREHVLKRVAARPPGK